MAVTPFISDIEMNRNIIYNACFHSDNEPPVNPVDGQYYLNLKDNKVYFYRDDDEEWHEVGDGAIYSAGNGIEISPTYVISVKDEVLNQIEQNKNDIKTLQEADVTMSETIVEMQQQIEVNKTNIKNIESDIDEIDQEIVVINTNILSIQNDVINLGSRISANERNIASNLNEINNLKDRVNETEANIAENKKAIGALDERVTTNETNIGVLQGDMKQAQQDIKDLDNAKISKSDVPDILTDITLERKSVTNVSIKESKYHPITNTVTVEDNILPLVSDENSGLATAELFNTVANNQERIAALELQGGRYIGKSFKTYSELKEFEDEKSNLDEFNIGDFTFVLKDEEHENATTRYILGLNGNREREFSFAYIINYEPVGNFTNTKAGLILGKEQNGYVFAESDGSGSVVGWDDLNNKVTNNTENLSNLQTAFDEFKSTSYDNLTYRVETLETNVEDIEQDISNLNTNKVNKDKLMSVVTDVEMNHSNDENEKLNVTDLEITIYDAVTDSSTTKTINLPLASPVTSGLMSIDDKDKLDGIEAGAQPNQNAFGTIKAGEYPIVSNSPSDQVAFVEGEGIRFDVDPNSNSIIINSLYAPITDTANWQADGLQSKFDKQREDKMGEEIWDAVIDEEGNYTLDYKDFTGYMGIDSHIYVRFIGENTTTETKLTVMSSTANHVLIEKAPIMKFGDNVPEVKFILDQSIWELVYRDDQKFYMVASSGVSMGGTGNLPSGFNNLQDGNPMQLIRGTLDTTASSKFSLMLEVTAFADDSKTASGILEVQANYIAGTGLDKNNTFLRWVSKSGMFKNSETTSETPVMSDGFSALGDENFAFYLADNEWSIVGLYDGSITLQYRVINSTDKDGNDLEIEILVNTSVSIPEANKKDLVYSTYDKVSSPENPNYQINSVIKLTGKEFAQLMEDGQIIPGMAYNVTDDQVETIPIVTIPDYNTFDPRSLGAVEGQSVNFKADANANFVTPYPTTGVIYCNEDTYMMLCQEGKNNGDLYYRTWANGKWGDWRLIAVSGSSGFDKYITSSDASVDDIISITQQEYDQRLLDGQIKATTMYNVVNEDGTAIVSRIMEYTSVTQIGLIPENDMDIHDIVNAMGSNSILWSEITADGVTIKGSNVKNGILQVIKIGSDKYYGTIIQNSSMSDNGYLIVGGITTTELYNDEAGTTGNVTLVDSVANYTKIRIYYKHASEEGEQYTEIYNANGKKAHISAIYEVSDGVKYACETLSISEDTITRETKGGSVSPFTILRVEGENSTSGPPTPPSDPDISTVSLNLNFEELHADECIVGKVLGTFNAIGGTGPFVYSLTETSDEFEISENQLKVKSAVSAGSKTIKFKVVDSKGKEKTGQKDFEVLEARPEISTVELIMSSEDLVTDTCTVGTVIGTFSATGGTEPYVYSLTEASTEFEISGTELKVKSAVTNGEKTIKFKVTDANNKTKEGTKTFSIRLPYPEITSVNLTLSPVTELYTVDCKTGTSIAQFVTVGGTAPYTYVLIDNVDKFEVEGDKLKVKKDLSAGSITLNYKVTDTHSKTKTGSSEFTIKQYTTMSITADMSESFGASEAMANKKLCDISVTGGINPHSYILEGKDADKFEIK